jgi:hypothetical protein
MIGERCFIVHTTGEGTIPLDSCSVERLSNIADKIHLEPHKRFASSFYSIGDKKFAKDETKDETTQTIDMAFEIKQNVPLPGVVMDGGQVVHAERPKTKCINYRNLPLKNMKVGECIILFEECTKDNISNRLGNAKTGIRRYLDIMDTNKKFVVAKTDDYKIGVWRVE